MIERWLAMSASDRRYLVAAMILAAVMAGFFSRLLVLSDYSVPLISPDGDGYVSVTEYLKGENDAPDLVRISRPIIPILALPLSYWMDTRASFLAINCTLFVLLVGVFYLLAKEMIKESQIAFAYDFDIFENARQKMVWIRSSPMSVGPTGLLRTLLGTFTVSLLFVPFGVLEFSKNVRHARLHLAMLIAALVTLLAIHVSSLRFAFVLFPLVFTINIRGIRYLVSKMQSLFGASDGSARIAQATLVAGVCSFNLLLYVAFFHYGSTIAMARHFLPFLID